MDKLSGTAESVLNSNAGHADEGLGALLAEAREVVRATERSLALLLAHANEIVADVTREQNELQRFMQEFSLEPTIYHLHPPINDEPGPTFDIEALRQGTQALAEQMNRALGLQSNIAGMSQVVQSFAIQLTPERAFRQIQETDDIRLQHAMNSAREDERRRLAREIHDGPAQVMANAIYAIQIAEQVARRAPDQVSEELLRTRELLKDGVAEIRRFMFDLRPTMLQDHGLSATLRRYVDDYNRFFGKKVQIQVDEPLPSITADQELTIFRIVQESLQNIHKHAGYDATASIHLSGQTGNIELIVRDTGRGFEPDAIVPRPGAGAGLPGMKERAKLAGAELTIESAVGVGTTVRLVMRGESASGVQ
jgi:two-component system sensor histidine kinase DegS